MPLDIFYRSNIGLLPGLICFGLCLAGFFWLIPAIRETWGKERLQLIFLFLPPLLCITAFAVAVILSNILSFVRQQELQGEFGQERLQLCNDISLANRVESPESVKLIFINASEHEYYVYYNEALPPNLKAQNQAELTAIVCLKKDRIELGTQKYTNGRECKRYRTIVDAYAIETTSGKVFNSTQFKTEPDSCPRTISSGPGSSGDITKEGVLPQSSEVVAWAMSLQTSKQPGNFASPTASPEIIRISYGEERRGTITAQRPLLYYSFDGKADEIITIRMDHVSGVTFDPLLYLYAYSGEKPELLTSNDNVETDNKNAGIIKLKLPRSGPYLIVATHASAENGSGQGRFVLVLSLEN